MNSSYYFSKMSAKAAKKAGMKKSKKSGKKTRVYSYRSYAYKVLKQVHPNVGVTKRSMSVMNSFIADIFDRLTSEATRLASYTKKKTLSSREIQTAVRLVLSGELAKHAVSQGTKAVTYFTSSSYLPSSTSYQPGKGKRPSKKVSRSKRAKITFPVGRIARLIRKVVQNKMRVGSGAPVYLAAVLEYLTAEIFELAGNAAKDNNKKRILPRHIQLAIRKDEELNKLLSSVTIASGGVLPHIHTVLQPKVSKDIRKTSYVASKSKKSKAKVSKKNYSNEGHDDAFPSSADYFSSWF